MLKFLKFLNKNPAALNLKENELCARPTRYRPIHSHVDGEFTFYAGEEALSAMEELVGLSFEDIEVLPARVLSKCRELGFAHNEPVHFIFAVQEVPRNICWVATKNVPPIEIERGKPAARSIVVFLPTLRQEIEVMKSEVLTGALMFERMGQPEKKDRLLKSVPIMVKNKYKTILTHEMVHIFATDEYRDIMEILGLELLELLTDSINLVTFYPDYIQMDDFQRLGVPEGIGYIANLLKGEQPGRAFGMEILGLAHERALLIIKECQRRCTEARSVKS